MGAAGYSSAQLGDRIGMVRIANIKPREPLRLLRRMGFEQDNRDHTYFYHHWLRIGVKVSHGDKEVEAGLMGDIVIKQLRMNSADEFRGALRGNIPRRYLDPNAPWDGQPLDQ